jgi:hypothetical protein
MRAALAIGLAICLTLLGDAPGRAGVDVSAVRSSGLELLVFEHADCTYCRVFRRDVLSKYPQSAPGQQAPLRFIDIAKSDTGGLGLRGGIDTLPTAVLMKEGREVDRIVGYWGPENFFKMLAFLLARAE